MIFTPVGLVNNDVDPISWNWVWYVMFLIFTVFLCALGFKYIAKINEPEEIDDKEFSDIRNPLS